MKRFFTILFAGVLLTLSSFEANANSLNWYFSCAKERPNTRPTLPAVEEELAKGIGADEKVLYLTFDAGYENGNVAKVVSTLDQENVRGAFFV